MAKKKIAVVFGTRPEAIKMAPVILELSKHSESFETVVIVTAQHREMLDQVLSVFNIKPDYDLNIMKKNQTLSEITSNVLKGLEDIFMKEEPDMVLVHGDTTTSFSAALAAFYQRIPVGHVEAGLRTYDKYFPFPEESNRQLIDVLADLYFVPTESTKLNLVNENKPKGNIIVTGNTVIDAIKYTKTISRKHEVLELMDAKPNQKWVLLTMHRRENHGEPMKQVFEAIVELLNHHKDIEVIMPVHLSPVVQRMTTDLLSKEKRVHLVDPLEVDIFHQVINKSVLVLTDSGGMQEEAPALNVPVLVLRDKTERPEGVTAGTLKLVGTNKASVIKETTRLLTNEQAYESMSKAINPYGDGQASRRIVSKIKEYFI